METEWYGIDMWSGTEWRQSGMGLICGVVQNGDTEWYGIDMWSGTEWIQSVMG